MKRADRPREARYDGLMMLDQAYANLTPAIRFNPVYFVILSACIGGDS
jgi:hypothetical protein